MEKSYEINVDIKKANQNYNKIEFVKGDVGNVLYINITDDDKVFDLSGKTFSISLLKFDKTVIVNGVEVVGTKLKYTLGTNDISCVGLVIAELQIHEGNKRISSSQFRFSVRDDIDTTDAIQSSTELPILTKLIEDVSNLKDGKSAYQIALENGFIGTEQQWLASLKGAQGMQGAKGETGLQGPKGETGSQGIQGIKGDSGLSAYQIWLSKGNVGTESDFLLSLKGAKGDKGETGLQGLQGIKGDEGLSSYQIWLSKGNTGTEADFLLSLKGQKGDTGSQGAQGLKGDKGDKGDTGQQGIQGIQGIQGAKGDPGSNAAIDILVADTKNHFLSANVEGCLDELFTFANDGKTAVASAVTAKGVTASSSDTFSTLATKIGQISGGGSSLPSVPAESDWVMPSDWIDISQDVPANGLSLLVNDTRDATYGFKCTTSAGQYQVDWGDGVVTLHNSGTIATHTYTIGAGQACSRGYSTFKVKITPVSGNLTGFAIDSNGTALTNQYFGVLWCVIKSTTLTTYANMFYKITTQNIMCYQLERFEAPTSGCATNSMATMFQGCYSLRSVNQFDTSNVTNFSYAFAYCLVLKEIPLFNTSKVTDMSGAFQGCKDIISIPLLDTSKVINMNAIFQECLSLQTIPQFDTTKVTNMASMFYSCYALVKVPLLDTTLVTSMASMFYNCSALQEVPLFNTQNVTSMSNMFNGTSIFTIPLLNTSKVTNMSGMFQNCKNLKTIPLLDTSLVTNMSNMFQSCGAMVSVPLLNTQNVTSFSQMFSGCNLLKEVPQFNTAKATSVNSMFSSCNVLKELPPLNLSLASDLTDYASYCYTLNKIEINAPLMTTVRITGNNYLKSIKITAGAFTGTSPQINVSNGLTAQGLNELFNSLPPVSGKTIKITGNLGAAACDTSIAVAKGWTVTN